METNDYQIGGNHYKTAYQHWDFVCDTGIHYLLGCATKYVARWRSKNGVEDLRKAIHYLAKAEDVNIFFKSNYEYWDLFCKNLPREEYEIMRAIHANHFNKARDLIHQLIIKTEGACEPGPTYIDPDYDQKSPKDNFLESKFPEE